MGDFNTVLSTQLDQARSTNRALLQGRDELISWMSALRLADPWRLQHPDVQELTGPTRAFRIDYLFVNYGLFCSVFNTFSKILRLNLERGITLVYQFVSAQLLFSLRPVPLGNALPG